MQPYLNNPEIKAFLSIIFVLALTSCSLSAQDESMAPVDVVVTNMEGDLRSGEKIILTSETDGKVYTGVSGKDGTFSVSLPTGQSYVIEIAAIGKDLEYTTFEIPPLGPGEFFSSAIVLTIQFEPAKQFTLDNVHFDTGKSTLRSSSYAELNELFEYLELKGDVSVEIAGHTDDVGEDDDNLKLSQARADAVKAYLVRKGISASRIRSVGYGETRPVAPNTTPEGRQQNRRTEVKILSE